MNEEKLREAVRRLVKALIESDNTSAILTQSNEYRRFVTCRMLQAMNVQDCLTEAMKHDSAKKNFNLDLDDRIENQEECEKAHKKLIDAAKSYTETASRLWGFWSARKILVAVNAFKDDFLKCFEKKEEVHD